MIEKAQGRLLYVRELQQLASASRMAIDELVDVFSSDEIQAQLVVVLSGEMGVTNDLLRRYPHLSACLPEEVCFPDFTPEHCADILQAALRRALVDVVELRNEWDEEHNSSEVKPAAVHDDQQLAIVALFQDLVALPSWKNAVDIECISNDISKVMGSRIGIPMQEVLEAMYQVVKNRQTASR
jgi:hypothetical protein